MNRRGILKLFGAAPVGLPVIAREAAAKAGIGGTLSGPVPSVGSYMGQAGGEPASEKDWVRDWCKQVFTSAWEEEKRREMRGWQPERLDSDLASSRSMSLSAALRIQTERNIERRIAREREEARLRYAKLFKMDFLP